MAKDTDNLITILDQIETITLIDKQHEDEEAILVCLLAPKPGQPMLQADNALTKCKFCNTPLQWHPSSAPKLKKLAHCCSGCATKKMPDALPELTLTKEQFELVKGLIAKRFDPVKH